MKIVKVITLIVFCNIMLSASGDKAESILEKVRAYASKVRDCQATVQIVPKIDAFKIPNTKATIYYKDPDKFKIKTEGMAFFPKTGFPFPPTTFLKKKFTVIQEADESVEKISCYVLKLIPSGEKSEIVLSTIWVDKQNYLIRKIESVTKVKGTFTIFLRYDNNTATQYGLPSTAIYSFDMSNGENPAADKNDNDANAGKKKKFTNGTVYAYFSEYKINAGVDDSVFKEKNKK